MHFPNLRYGNPEEFRYYAESYPRKERVQRLSRQLRRSERTIRNWLDGKEKLPWWVPEIIRLQRKEHADMMRQMGFARMETRLGLVKGEVLEFRPPTLKKEQPQPPKDDAALFTLRESPALNNGLIERVDHAPDELRILAG